MKRLYIIIYVGLVLASLPLVAYGQLKRVSPRKVHLSEEKLARADSAIMDAIGRGEIPGAVLGIVKGGCMAYVKAYGNRQVYPSGEKMTIETMFDLASCSKPVATAISVMQLCENGTLRLTDAVSAYIPGFANWTDSQGNSETIRIQHLLTHTSGLPAYASVDELVRHYGSPSPQGLLEHICQVKRSFEPGTDFQYSCLNYITLQHIVERCTGLSLRDYARTHIFAPLLRGQVHDPLARVMNGGVSGNAGVFSTVDDLAVLCAALQNGGQWQGARILSPATVLAMRSVPQWASQIGRTYGWDVHSPYASCNGSLLSPQTYGHTGYTGTSIVIDPVNDVSIILLVNAVHPIDGRSRMVRLRSLISNIVAGAMY